MQKTNKGLQPVNGGYVFRSGKCSISVTFARAETAPTIEEVLVKLGSSRYRK